MHPIPRIAVAALALVAFLAPPATADWTGDPLPGVDILVKKKPSDRKTRLYFGRGGGSIQVEAGFFGPGSEPFTGEVELESRHVNTGTVGHVDHGRYDLVGGPVPHQADLLLTPLKLRSVSPGIVTIDASETLLDIAVDLFASSGDTNQAIGGELWLPDGTTLPPGTSTWQVDSFFDIEYRISFTNSDTGDPMGQELVGTLRLHSQELDLPVTRLPSEAGGAIVLGYDGNATVPYSFADPNDELRLTLEAALVEEPVAVERSSIGALKARVR